MRCYFLATISLIFEFLSSYFKRVTLAKKGNISMSLTNAERQRQYREKMKERNLSLVRVWVPKNKVVEIKSIAVRLVKESLKNKKFGN
ncbi:MAG: hypothetical protein BGO67_00540 [Alphaproteobacteria bacterium 41-28]|jgi:hypothetical protein|nr:MAG: hypothetical protein BGO67_00540 [Alphaproteobacteria bacterium 41-28]